MLELIIRITQHDRKNEGSEDHFTTFIKIGVDLPSVAIFYPTPGSMLSYLDERPGPATEKGIRDVDVGV